MEEGEKGRRWKGEREGREGKVFRCNCNVVYMYIIQIIVKISANKQKKFQYLVLFLRSNLK